MITNIRHILPRLPPRLRYQLQQADFRLHYRFPFRSLVPKPLLSPMLSFVLWETRGINIHFIHENRSAHWNCMNVRPSYKETSLVLYNRLISSAYTENSNCLTVPWVSAVLGSPSGGRSERLMSALSTAFELHHNEPPVGQWLLWRWVLETRLELVWSPPAPAMWFQSPG